MSIRKIENSDTFRANIRKKLDDENIGSATIFS